MFLDKNRITFNTTAARYSTLVMELDIARCAGYTAVEISQDKVRRYLDAGYSVDDLRNELDGLVVHGVGALVDIERQGSVEKELFREADKLFMLAYAIGAKGVQIVWGRWTSRRSWTSTKRGIRSFTRDFFIIATTTR